MRTVTLALRRTFRNIPFHMSAGLSLIAPSGLHLARLTAPEEWLPFLAMGSPPGPEVAQSPVGKRCWSMKSAQAGHWCHLPFVWLQREFIPSVALIYNRNKEMACLGVPCPCLLRIYLRTHQRSYAFKTIYCFLFTKIINFPLI